MAMVASFSSSATAPATSSRSYKPNPKRWPRLSRSDSDASIQSVGSQALSRSTLGRDSLVSLRSLKSSTSSVDDVSESVVIRPGSSKTLYKANYVQPSHTAPVSLPHLATDLHHGILLSKDDKRIPTTSTKDPQKRESLIVQVKSLTICEAPMDSSKLGARRPSSASYVSSASYSSSATYSTASSRPSLSSRHSLSAVTYGSSGPRSRPSDDPSAIYDFLPAELRPNIPTRATSWDGSNFAKARIPGVAAPGRPNTLLKPQRLSAPGRLRNQPGDGFRKLPKEVLDVVMKELRGQHISADSGASNCATCYMRDLCAVSLTSRKLAASARPALYGSIWIVGHDSPSHMKKHKMKYGVRLRFLRRTLREKAELAKYVKELKVPDVPSIVGSLEEREKYLDLIASVVMACPDLERLVGLHETYHHEYTRLTHALSTRTQMAEHVWNISPSKIRRQRQEGNGGSQPGSMFPEQATAFIEYHSMWSNLTTLVVHCSPGGSIDPEPLKYAFAHLPSLQNLALSNIADIPVDIFNHLPPLNSLHLSHLPNLPSVALSTFATTPSATTLTHLTFSQLPLPSLAVLARLMANLISLTHLKVIQDKSPSLPAEASIILQPYLASSSLTHLTWDILIPSSDPDSDATRILARSIKANGFPKLAHLKAPCDYDGVLQRLCKPVEKLMTTGDRYRKAAPGMGAMGASVNGGAAPPWQRKDSGFGDRPRPRSSESGIGVEGPVGGKSVNGPGFGNGGVNVEASPMQKYTRSLTCARLSAQARLEASRQRPKFNVVVEEYTDIANPVVIAVFEMGGYMGKVGCENQLVYDLSPDVDGWDVCGLDVGSLVQQKEDDGRCRGICDGAWNKVVASSKVRLSLGGKAERALEKELEKEDRKREKARLWEHSDRRRWVPLPVGKLF